MKNCFLFFSCLFVVLHVNAQQDKKEVFALPITSYIVAANDSVTVVQVEMPPGFNVIIEKEQLGLMRHNYSNSKDTTGIGWGRCQLIKSNYYYFAMHCHDKSIKPQKDDMVYTMVGYPAALKGRIFGLVKNAIYFQHVTEEKFYDFITPASMNEQQENSLIDSLVADIKYTGKEMLKQNNGQDQDVKGGIFDGKKLFAAMQTVTRAHVKDFIDYVLARPQKYAGNNWKIAETFATWMVNSTPTVIK
jgi:hypothetical protein